MSQYEKDIKLGKARHRLLEIISKLPEGEVLELVIVKYTVSVLKRCINPLDSRNLWRYRCKGIWFR